MRLPRTALVVVATVSIAIAGLTFNRLITRAVSDDAPPNKQKAQLKALFNDSGATERDRRSDPLAGDKTAVAHDHAASPRRPREGWLLDASARELASRKALLEKLDQPVTIQIEEVPLREAIHKLGDDLGVKVRFDKDVIVTTNGASLDNPVTIDAENEPAEAVLSALLKQSLLTWQPRGGVVFISTPDELEANPETVAYDVTDLVVDEAGKADLSTLFHILESSLAPDSWQTVGGSGSLTPVVRGRTVLMLVRHDFHIQRRVANLLATLRTAGLAHEPSTTVSTFTLVPLPEHPTVVGTGGHICSGTPSFLSPTPSATESPAAAQPAAPKP